MMRKSTVTLMVLLIVLAATISAQDIRWERLYGFSGYDQSFDVAVTADGGYIMAGHIDSYGVDDIWVIRTDADGDTIWTRQYGETELSENAFDIDTVSGGGFLVTGYSGATYNEETDVWVLRLNSDGDTLWSYTYDVGYHDYGLCALETSDGGYLISGHVGSQTDHSLLLLKLATDGTFESASSHPGPYPATAGYDIVVSSDGGCLVAGITGTESPQDVYDVYAIKFDSNLDSVWAVNYGDSYDDRGYALAAASDGGCAITGFGKTELPGAGVFWVLRLDADGDTLWTRRFPGSTGESGGHAIVAVQAGGFIVGGWVGSVSDVNTYLIQLDPDGDTLWTMEHGGGGYDFIHGIALIEDTSYVATGYSSSGSAGGYDCYLFRFETPRYEFFTEGDADGNGIVNIADAVHLISYIFGGGTAPDPLAAGDADCNDIVNIADAVYLISYIFGGGPAPGAGCR